MADERTTNSRVDYTDAGFRSAEALSELRRTCPVPHSTDFGGYYALTRYDDIARAAHDADHFSCAHGVTIPDYGRGVRLKPQQADPPEHGKYRKILLPFFTSDRIGELAPAIRSIVRDLVQSFSGRGSADLVHELGLPVP